LLESGNLVDAHSEANVFLKSALSTADPYLQALAWELQSRISIAEKAWSQAHEFVKNGLAIVTEFDVPVAASHIHTRAWELCMRANEQQQSKKHRAQAENHILTIADSFSPDEPLREIFLSAPPVRRLLEGGKRKPVAKGARSKSAAPDK
jgi:hypothetical protein